MNIADALMSVHEITKLYTKPLLPKCYKYIHCCETGSEVT